MVAKLNHTMIVKRYLKKGPKIMTRNLNIPNSKSRLNGDGPPGLNAIENSKVNGQVEHILHKRAEIVRFSILGYK